MMKKKMRHLAFALALAAALPAPAQEQPADSEAGADPVKRAVVEKLETVRVTLDFRESTLEDVISYLRDMTGLNFHIDADVLAASGPDQRRVTMKVKDLLLKSALKLILSARDLTAVYREGVLLIVSKDKAPSTLVTRVYDVRDLLFRIQDFVGPRVELMTPTGGAPLTGATFALDEEPRAAITEDFVVELVKANTGERSWDDVPGASVDQANGLLIVTQSKSVHKEVARLLDMLRQFK